MKQCRDRERRENQPEEVLNEHNVFYDMPSYIYRDWTT